MFTLISCIGKNREIGRGKQLVFNIKEDMKWFRETTTGHPVVMGYNTWNSLPGKLKNRENLVVSYKDVPEADRTIKDLDEFIKCHKDIEEEIFIIGGGMIYTAFLPYAKRLFLTEVDATADDATVFFPKFDKSKYSRKVIKKGKDHDLTFTIVQYTKK
ncbi:dihydrofolate reductase [Candidatus Saccharibacteria bacterium]|nr:dihydrofolate reductase [Candidatus Saccharibacteria bacterium]